ncbi:hypothetical protein F8M41_021366 [Gigaspora margarita]|uniref:Uncharacterized protein n=1 Tax=Gigaspora margarita TaxID=4874 RepID=A0A8H4AGV9_GIGMA|nr:hypothetical protein F8M41_021366 [Gigaspora margarita]
MRNFKCLIVVYITFTTLVASHPDVNDTLLKTFTVSSKFQNLGAEQNLIDEILCKGSFDLIHKSSTEDIPNDIPKDTINTHITIECNKDFVRPSITSCSLQKYVNDSWVDMKLHHQCRELKTTDPKTTGWFMVGRYALSALPSECYNAPPGGMLGGANSCVNFGNIPSSYVKTFSNPCTNLTNHIKGCPPSSPPSCLDRSSSSLNCTYSSSAPLSIPLSYFLTISFLLFSLVIELDKIING